MRPVLIVLLAIAAAAVFGSCQNTAGPLASGASHPVVQPISRVFKTLGSTDVPDSLAPVFPNPFNRVTGDSLITIYFSLRDTADAILLIQNPFGDSVAVFRDAHLEGGNYIGQWAPVNAAGDRLREGLYFITLRAENASQARSFINSELFSIEAN